MVVETQAMVHPPKTKRELCVVVLFPLAAITAKRTAQTKKQQML
jgi:hypothetical protein